MADSLRSRVVRGAGFLLLRRAGGAPIRIGGLFVVTALIGPTAFGVFAGASAVVWAVADLLNRGMFLLVVRSDDDERDQVLSGQLAIAGAASAIGLVVGLPLAYWIGSRIGEAPAAIVTTLGLAPTMVIGSARGRVEAVLDYGPLTRVELIHDLIFVAVSVGLAFAGAGALAPAIAWCLSQSYLAIGLLRVGGQIPRPAFARGEQGVEERRFLLGATGSSLPLAAGSLLNPVVIGTFEGAAAVGVVALAERLVRQASFLLELLRRIAEAGFAQVRNDARRLRSAHADGTLAVTLAVGLCLVVCAWFARYGAPPLLGEEWTDISAVAVWLLVAEIVSLPTRLHPPVLNLAGRHGAVGSYRTVRLALYIAAAWPCLAIWGVAGFGVAAVVSAASIVMIDRSLRSSFSPEYGFTPLLSVAFAVASIGALVDLPIGLAMVAPVVLLTLRPTLIRRVLEIVRSAQRPQAVT